MRAMDARPCWIAARLERIDYEHSEHFQVTRNFLNRREACLDVLLNDDEA